MQVSLAGREGGRGILGWSLCNIASTELDGLLTVAAETHLARHDEPGPASPASPQTGGAGQGTERLASNVPTEHPNGIVAIDHVVAMSPDLDRSVRVLQAAGLDLRRIREQPTPAGAPRQAFFRLGEVILEVVQEPDEVLAARPDGAQGAARFWGLALLCDDLERSVEQLGEHSSEIRAAVQPGRHIATLRRSAGLAVPVALMSRAD